MKKATLFMACCIGLMLFASCKKDVRPTITIVENAGYVSPNSEVYSGDPITVGFDVTGENLIQITMVAIQDDVALFTHTEALGDVSSYSYTKTFTIRTTGDVTIKGTIFDVKGNMATRSFTVKYKVNPNPTIQPTISVATGPEYVSPNSEVLSGDPVTVGFNVNGEYLNKITMVAEQNGVALFTDSETLNNVTSYSYSKTFTIEATGTVTIKGTVTDARGNSATTNFDIQYTVMPDVQPTISVITEPGYLSEGSEASSDSPVTVGFNAAGENLTQITMVAEQDGVVLFTDSETLDNVASYAYTKTFTIGATGTVTITGTVTDARGNTATTSFEVNFGEAPNALFLGHYEGTLLVNGNANINLTNMDPMDEVLENEPVPAVIDITAGEGANQVVAIITFNEQTSTVNGTVEGNNIHFEAINDVLNYNYNYQGFTVTIPINMTYAIEGLLNGEQLDLEGTCQGDGDVNLFVYTGTLAFDGTIGGSVNKTR